MQGTRGVGYVMALSSAVKHERTRYRPPAVSILERESRTMATAAVPVPEGVAGVAGVAGVQTYETNTKLPE